MFVVELSVPDFNLSLVRLFPALNSRAKGLLARTNIGVFVKASIVHDV